MSHKKDSQEKGKSVDMFGLIAVSLLVGLLVGILSGLLGVGGGTLFMPLFKLAYGLPAIACTATSMMAIVFTSVSGAVSHLRNRTCLPWLGLAAGLGGALTSPVGVYLATLSPEWMIMVAAAAIIAYSAITMLRKGLALPKLAKGEVKQQLRKFWSNRKPTSSRPSASTPSSSRPSASTPSSSRPSEASGEIFATPEASSEAGKISPLRPAASGRDDEVGGPAASGRDDEVAASDFHPTFPLVAKGALIGLCAGVMSGYVGVGGGFIMVPMMLQILKAPMRLVSGTSLIAVFILAVPSVIYQAILGNVAWAAGIAIAIGSMPGAVIGAKVLPYVPERALRLMFGGFLLVVAALMVVNQLGVWG